MPRRLNKDDRGRRKDQRAKGRTYVIQDRRRVLDAIGSALTPTILLAVTVLACLAILGVAAFGYFNDRAWATVARVQGQDINRAAVRDREATLRFAVTEQIALITSLERTKRMDSSETAALIVELEGMLDDINPVAVSGLVDASLTHAYAVANSVTADVDPGQQLLAARVGLTDRKLQWIRIAWQPPTQGPDAGVTQPAHRPDPEHMSVVGQQLRAELDTAASNPEVIADRYRAAGWHATTGTRWLPRQGAVDGLDAEVVDAARQASIGPLGLLTGPGWATVANVIDLEEPDPVAASALLSNAINEGIAEGAIRAWALERAEREAVTEHLLGRWESEPTTQSRAAEVSIGPADPEGPTGPWVELVHLVVADLPRERIPPGSGSDADRVVSSLRSLDPIVRGEEFRELVAASAGDRSGELGFFVKEQLDPALGNAAFAPEVTTNTVLGPIKTDLGDELYLVASRFAGALDDRAIGALLEVRDGASLTDVVASAAPGNAALALGGPWRVPHEFPPGSPGMHAFFDTPLGVWSDPFTIDDRLAVARVLERGDGPPEQDAMARLRVGGYEAWLRGQRAAASITYSEGLREQASPSPSPGGVPTLLPQGTPRLPITPPQVEPL